jgi:hypothetical protein
MLAPYGPGLAPCRPQAQKAGWVPERTDRQHSMRETHNKASLVFPGGPCGQQFSCGAILSIIAHAQLRLGALAPNLPNR